MTCKTKQNYIFKILSFLLILIMVTACDSAQSRAKRIVSLRAERKQMLEKLYQEYGGSELSQSIKSGIQNEKESESDSGNQIVQGLANIAQGADRTIFEQNIRTIGSGENLITITDKAKQFYSRSAVMNKAKKVREIDIELEQLEKK